MGREQVIRLNVTVTSGTGSGTFTNQWDIVRRLRIIPPSESATYVAKIKDADGHLIFDSNATGGPLTGTLSTLSEFSLGIMRTVEISSGSEDGTYIVKLDMH